LIVFRPGFFFTDAAMRPFLDQLYRTSGALAAFFLSAICIVVLLQVGANVVDAAARFLTGEPIGLVVPSYAEFTGFFLAAASFFALAYTLRSGDHIRVSLFIQHLEPGPRRRVEIWCAALGAFFAGYFTWYMAGLVGESFRYGDVSPGMVLVALWIPQTAMALGLLILTIALLDELACLLSGRDPAYLTGDDAIKTPGKKGDDAIKTPGKKGDDAIKTPDQNVNDSMKEKG